MHVEMWRQSDQSTAIQTELGKKDDLSCFDQCVVGEKPLI